MKHSAYWDAYLRGHADPTNRRLHACGWAVFFASFPLAAAFAAPEIVLAAVPIAYGLAWTGHFVFERNVPDTFHHPIRAGVSSLRMFLISLTGRASLNRTARRTEEARRQADQSASTDRR